MKLFFITLFIFLLIAVAVITIVGYLLSTPGYKGIITDHFNGSKFQNQGGVAIPHGFKDFIKWRMTSQRQKWPNGVENMTYPKPSDHVNEATTIRVTYVNHATALIQVNGLNILTDPIWSDRCSPFSWVGPKRVRKPGIRFEDLPPIDAILISHNHYDHMDMETLKKLKFKFNPSIFVGLGNRDYLESKGFERVTEMDWWQTSKINEDATVTFVPATHFSNRGLFDSNKTIWGGFVLQSSGGNVYFSGDSGYGPHYSQIHNKFGTIDLALMPIGAYEPRWFMSTVHMNPDDAVKAHMDLHAKNSMGIHFGTFQLTDEGIDDPIRDLNAALKKYGIPANQFWTLDFGEMREISNSRRGK